jgi:hypothetical protein
MTASKLVVTVPLTFVTYTVTCCSVILARQRTGRDGTSRLGARAVPRAVLQTAPGRLRASIFRHYRPECEVLAGRGQVTAGNARKNCVRCCPRNGDRHSAALIPSPRKHGLEQSLGEEISPWPEPRWDADRRAPPAGGAAVPSSTAGWLHASVGVPFPFFRSCFVGWAEQSEAHADQRFGNTSRGHGAPRLSPLRSNDAERPRTPKRRPHSFGSKRKVASRFSSVAF